MIAQYPGETQSPEASSTDPTPARGRVVQALGPQWVVSVDGRTVRCIAPRSLRRALVRPVVGDWVELERVTPELSRIVRVLPRKNSLRRADVHRRGRTERVIVANVDQLLVVGSVAQPRLNPGLMDRFMVAAWRDRIQPILCITKIDLPLSDWARAVIASYEELEIPMVQTSAVTGDGLDALRNFLEGTTTALAGLSGTGKTTLVRHLTGDFSLEIGEISQATGRGRHITTSARLLPIADLADSYVVDLPGQRVFGLVDVTPEELLRGFPDLEKFGRCPLPSCRHEREPGCVLLDAVDKGLVPRRRLEALRRIWRSLEEEGMLKVGGTTRDT